MTEEQLKFLIQFKREGIAATGKTTKPDLQNLVSELKSLNIIAEKQTSTTLEIIDMISFEKLIEIKSLGKFKKWYNKNRLNPGNEENIFKKVITNPWVIAIVITILAAILNSDKIKSWINKLINGF